MLETKTKTKRKRSNSPAPPNVETVSMANVLTLVEAAAYLRVSELDLLNLLRQQDLPGRQIGQEWRILRTALDHWLSTPCSRDRLLRHAGAAKDDPDLDQMLVDIYQKRGRPMVGETP